MLLNYCSICNSVFEIHFHKDVKIQSFLLLLYHKCTVLSKEQNTKGEKEERKRNTVKGSLIIRKNP